MDYQNRLFDETLKKIFPALPAILIEGAKGVGKTETASKYVKTIFHMDDPIVRDAIESDFQRLINADKSVLIDEWQYSPLTWDRVRHAVDDGLLDINSTLLTGSSIKVDSKIHSGSGRIVRLRMDPFSIEERFSLDARNNISLRKLLESPEKIGGSTNISFSDYINEIYKSGLPGIRRIPEVGQEFQIESYVENIISHDFEENGFRTLKPASLKSWLTAFATSSATVNSFSNILKMASNQEIGSLTAVTANAYREALEILFIVDELQPFKWSGKLKDNLAKTPKHFVFDPAIITSLLNLKKERLDEYRQPESLQKYEINILGQLFESFVYQSLKTYTSVNRFELSHFRTKRGDHEVDFVVRDGNKLALFEVKTNPVVKDEYLRHMKWLEEQVSNDFKVVKVLLNTGTEAYTRLDGVHVIPIGMLIH
jgi:predicted AAA+ superfamily ATPase